MIKSKLTRRDLLQKGGFAIAGLPFLEYFAAEQAFAAGNPGHTKTGAPKRLIVVFNGLGTVTNEWYNKNDPNYEFGKILKPLQSHREDMTLIRGLTHSSNGGTHEAVELAALTGQPYVGDRKTTKFAAGISMDQRIANMIGENTLKKSISFSIQGKPSYNPLSHFGHSLPNFPIKDPYLAFDQVLSGVSGGNVSTSPSREQQLQIQRERVLQETQARYNELSSVVGIDDRQRLEAHQSSLERLLKGLQNINDQIDQGGSSMCTVTEPSQARHPLLPNRGAPYKHITEEWLGGDEAWNRNQDIVKTYMDIGVQALACDVSRVFVMDQAHFQSHSKDNHQANPNNRGTNPGAYDNVVEAGVRSAENLNYLINELKNTPEGDGGNMLDSTLIYWCYSHSDGLNHKLTDCIDVLVGNAGGMFDTNRLIKASGYHNQLLTSIINCFDIGDTGFGKKEWQSDGRLKGLNVAGF